LRLSEGEEIIHLYGVENFALNYAPLKVNSEWRNRPTWGKKKNELLRMRRGSIPSFGLREKITDQERELTKKRKDPKKEAWQSG